MALIEMLFLQNNAYTWALTKYKIYNNIFAKCPKKTQQSLTFTTSTYNVLYVKAVLYSFHINLTEKRTLKMPIKKSCYLILSVVLKFFTLPSPPQPMLKIAYPDY